jgi:hypothetical protein
MKQRTSRLSNGTLQILCDVRGMAQHGIYNELKSILCCISHLLLAIKKKEREIPFCNVMTEGTRERFKKKVN